jgi:diaminohydroxyphosphoribosylaminopyrimidine deaminase/5-amino-6-(5-phosphoribosylamino)uracil reductase
MTTLPLDALDRQRLDDALALAELAIGLSEPNPRVGCVIGRRDGSLLGQGHTQAAGGPHAEVMALRDAQLQGADVRGATAWVTLEPCAHHGRTPPCADALVAAGVGRVVVAMVDPFPQVAGQGLARLRSAGIAVELADGDIARRARDLNIGFLHRIEQGRPWVRLKTAVTLDGRTALPDGRSQWITGTEARTDVHRWRRRAGAVLTGIGTVLADDPSMDVRLVPTPRQPLRVVIDSRLRLPPQARLLHARAAGSPDGRVLVLAPVGAQQRETERTQALRAQGAEVVEVEGDREGRPRLDAVLVELGRRQINELHVEAGPSLSGAWLAAGLVDELLIYQAPVLLGDGLPLAVLPSPGDLAQAMRWHRTETAALGADLRLRLARA